MIRYFLLFLAFLLFSYDASATSIFGGIIDKDTIPISVIDTGKDFVKMSSSLGSSVLTAWAFKSIRKSI